MDKDSGSGSLLHDLDYDDNKKCNISLKRTRSKIAFTAFIALTIVLAVLIALAFLLFKSPDPPPHSSPFELCKDNGYALIPLGIYGGITEGDLTSFLLTQSGSPYLIALDAGAIFAGLQVFVENTQRTLTDNHHSFYLFDFPPWAVSIEQQVGWIMKNKIAGYFIGHPHLDHLMGLMSIAPEDYFIDPSGSTLSPKKPKSIIGLSSTIGAIERDLFNGVVWANFPAFGQYDYQYVEDGNVSLLSSLLGNITSGIGNIFPNNVTVTTHRTCHDSLNSSAFLFNIYNNNFNNDVDNNIQFLFFSDTGVPSSVPLSYCDWTGRLLNVWKSVDIKKLRAIVIEVSFQNSVPDSGMFGHLRPKDLLAQLNILANINQVTSLSSLTVIVEHIKPILGNVGANQFGSDARKIIKDELQSANNLGVNFVFPEQGKHICI